MLHTGVHSMASLKVQKSEQVYIIKRHCHWDITKSLGCMYFSAEKNVYISAKRSGEKNCHFHRIIRIFEYVYAIEWIIKYGQKNHILLHFSDFKRENLINLCAKAKTNDVLNKLWNMFWFQQKNNITRNTLRPIKFQFDWSACTPRLYFLALLANKIPAAKILIFILFAAHTTQIHFW